MPEAAGATLQEAVAWGGQLAQQARAQEGGNDADQSGAATATWANAEEEAGRGGAENAARPDVEVEPGRGDADNAARPGAGDEAGRGIVEDAARPGTGAGETGGDAPEHPVSQEEGETRAPEGQGRGSYCSADGANGASG